MNQRNDFCIIIISHGRPNDVLTLKTLEKAGCTLPTYILIDDQDSKQDEYLKKYPEQVFIFDKAKYAERVDQFDNFNNLRTTTHARNAAFDLSKDLGYEYFLVLDDDYTSFKFRLNHEREHPKSCPNMTAGIDEVFLSTLEYFRNAPFASICFSQGGDWFGGEQQFNKKPKRKAMNSFFCSINRKFDFFSRLNEDVNTYMELGKKGVVFMTIPFIQLDQKQTQKTAGGMSDAYLAGGTYVKSFYTIMCRPDCTKINLMGRSDLRMHHLINWTAAVPLIVPEKYKKR